MTQKERLVDLLEGFELADIEAFKGGWIAEKDSKRIADYLLKNGVIVPPCKVGDTVYRLDIDCTMPNDFDCDDNCYSCKHMVSSVLEFPVRSCVNQVFVMNEYGKVYFSTREAAEKALKERETE